ncbi:MAG: cyclodeaminase/cyclohydrolase family protein [Candidatus Omnitrophica bacterium]|nr:cyclodeaminase/cyclohydrolase family protein [Candidatus Omnitrophota bacterium]
MGKFTSLSLSQYLDQLSSDEPVPGGGSVSAYAAALAMGLSQMVARIRLKRKKKAGMMPKDEKKETEDCKTIQKIIESLEKTRHDAFQIVDLDPQIYQEVIASYGHPEKLEDSLQNSFRLQADLAFLAVMAREWNTILAGLVRGAIKNDLLVSAALLEAAFRGAYHTAMINVRYMKDPQHKERAEKALEELKLRFEKGNVGASQRS